MLRCPQVLGWEGFWGTVGMAVVGMPLAWVIPGSDIGAPSSEDLCYVSSGRIACSAFRYS